MSTDEPGHSGQPPDSEDSSYDVAVGAPEVYAKFMHTLAGSAHLYNALTESPFPKALHPADAEYLKVAFRDYVLNLGSTESEGARSQIIPIGIGQPGHSPSWFFSRRGESRGSGSDSLAPYREALSRAYPWASAMVIDSAAAIVHSVDTGASEDVDIDRDAVERAASLIASQIGSAPGLSEDEH
jgi:hypothetical protein